MKTKYRVLTACDCYFGNFQKFQNWETWSSDYSLTVNAPIPARHTLLAEMLRSGITEHNPREKQHVRKVRKIKLNRDFDPVKIESLVGRLIGVELEYYPNQIQRNNKLQDTCYDGSLGDGGRELRRLTWISKDGRLESLSKLKRLSGKVDKRCGLHVHIDVRHLKGVNGVLTAEQTYDRICLLFPSLKKLVPPSRIKNKYCQWKNNRLGSLHFKEPRHGLRYSAVNWQSYRKHGTIEFRCQGGTVNLLKAEMWSLFCSEVVNICSIPTLSIPTGTRQFNWLMSMLTEPVRTWCVLRAAKFENLSTELTSRVQESLEN